ncbi:hypothetical protein GUJ93_ZPchr0010g7702 [Zizania palustris]|uniref:Uncharacterized protein n=1 Tax=Zizania palustris TaxID=103762 RepID=A0A8J5TBJ9_ZIZPA|nr:hypothetical protein GUJ93_ZPchr0010g7702 [Zizania palustris]
MVFEHMLPSHISATPLDTTVPTLLAATPVSLPLLLSEQQAPNTLVFSSTSCSSSAMRNRPTSSSTDMMLGS